MKSLFFIVFNTKRKFVHLIKLTLAVAILVILMSQLAGIVQSTEESYRRWLNRNHPHGNPIKVFKDVDESILNSESLIINKLKEKHYLRIPVE
ncbi:MAG: hypothetical protein ACOY46_10935 [Bacillota bacterium]